MTSTFTHEHGYTAAITTEASCLPGKFCDVSVAANDTRYTLRDNEEVVEYVMGMNVVDYHVTGLHHDAPDSLVRAPGVADRALTSMGWERTGPWEVSDNALYAPVKRA